MLKAILILPFNVLVIVPIIILFFSPFEIKITLIKAVAMSVLSIVGLILAIWTMLLFYRTGKGSPAPWNPIETLIITGPYAYVRNPMLMGVFCLLLAESVFFRSDALFLYFVIFVLINSIYFPLFEEKALLKRYGDAYRVYKQYVPRFIPRLTPWKGDKK